MSDNQPQRACAIGMIGLGVMGRNLVLNMADHGFSVAGYDKDPAKVEALRKEAQARDVTGADELKEFLGLLRRPRAVMLLIPAGAPVEAVITELQTLLEPGDLIIDAGNSYFKDTDRHASLLAVKGIQFLGVGVSGGESGARHGPSIMPGGPPAAYAQVRPVFEAVAAQVDGEPCVSWLGPGSAGHFVKMVHNGIEYGVMELIAESYDLLKRGLGLSNDEMSAIYASWSQGELNSFLIEITSQILAKPDVATGKRLLDEILDVARQKGTGMWTSQCAMDLQVPIPTIDAAVTMRYLSALELERQQASAVLAQPALPYTGDRQALVNQLQGALYAGMLITYAQGMAVLAAASTTYAYQLDLEAVMRLWRGGCIIRASMLAQMCTAYARQPGLPNLLLDAAISQQLLTHAGELRSVIAAAVAQGLPVLGFMTALGYLDGYRSAKLPANLVQAQRDYFGAHTYERTDVAGSFHTEWEKE